MEKKNINLTCERADQRGRENLLQLLRQFQAECQQGHLPCSSCAAVGKLTGRKSTRSGTRCCKSHSRSKIIFIITVHSNL